MRLPFSPYLFLCLFLMALPGGCLPPNPQPQPEGESAEGMVEGTEGTTTEGDPVDEGEATGAIRCTDNCVIEIVQKYPHDPGAFTQGLTFDAGLLYEGTGLYGSSSLRLVDLATGTSNRRLDLPQQYFGEGIAILGEQIVQLTWRSGVAFVYDRDTFAFEGQFSYPTQGWGITHDGARYIMSDGSNRLYFRDLDTFEQLGMVSVADDRGAVRNLNELEYIHGEVFANIWQSNRIARIDPESGAVNSYLDASGLLTASEAARADVLNGIAYDVTTDKLYITGKNWPWLFEIRIVPTRQ